MTIDDKIKDEKLQYDIKREAAKMSAISSGKIGKYDYLTGEEIMQFDQSRITEQAKFTYCPLGKAFERQVKTIEDQREKQTKALEKHGKKLVEYSKEKEPSTHSKQKEIYEDIVNKRMEEIQYLSKQIDFNNLSYYYKSKNDPNNFIGFIGPLSFYRSIKEGNRTLEKSEEQQKEIKLELNEIVKGSKKSED